MTCRDAGWGDALRGDQGTGTLGKILSGVVVPKGMASLSVPSWNQVQGWLKEMDALRKATELTA